MLAFDSYVAANEWGKANSSCDHSGGLSKQAWNITAKIREIDSKIRPQDQSFTIEAHPELAFQSFNGGLCPDRKRSAKGMKQRIDLLSAEGFEGLERCIESLDKKQASPDDLLDACALAVVAQRKDQGQAQCLWGDPLYDEKGLRMEIWY